MASLIKLIASTRHRGVKVVHGLRGGGAAGRGPAGQPPPFLQMRGGRGGVCPFPSSPWFAPPGSPPWPAGPRPLQHVSGGTHLTGLTEVSESPATTAK